MNIRSMLLSLSFLSTVACGATVDASDARSPLPESCQYIDPKTETGQDESEFCPTGTRSAIAVCSDGEPYPLARCTRSETVPGAYCCPVSVWPRDEDGNLVAPPTDGAGGSGGMGTGGTGPGGGGVGGVM